MRVEYTTKTTEFSQITFFLRGIYVYCQYKAAPDNRINYRFPQGREVQICEGGDFTGETITATDSTLKSTAQKWIKQRRKYLLDGGEACIFGPACTFF